MGNQTTKPRRALGGPEIFVTDADEEQQVGKRKLSTVTSTGLDVNGSVHADQVVSFVNNCGTINFTRPTSKTYADHLEFNVLECVHTFTGRDEFIQKLHENIWSSQPSINVTVRSRSFVICGMPGVGKTQVARKYIQTYKHLYDYVLWINAEKKSEATSCFLRLAKDLRISTDVRQNGKQSTDDNIFNEVYDFVFQKSTLIVFDNAGSYKAEDGKDGLLMLLPQTIKTGWKIPSIVVTTRNRNWKDFTIEELTGLELSKSVAFLSILASAPSEDDQKNLLQKVANMYQGLPLALHQVRTYFCNKMETRAAIDGEPYTLKEFFSEVNSNRGILMTPSDLEYKDMYTLLDMTFKDVYSMKHGKLALQCLDVMTLLNPEFIPIVLMKSIFSKFPQELPEGLMLLNKYNLITLCKHSYQIHRVVQAAKRLESNNRNSKFAYVKHNLSKIVKSVTKFLLKLPINSQNLLEILNSVVRLHDQAAAVSEKGLLNLETILACKLQEAGSYKAAIKLFENVIKIQSKSTGSHHADTLNAKHRLAMAFDQDGKHNDGEKLYKEVLKNQVDLLGPVHSNTLCTKHNLAVVFQHQGKYSEALELHKEVLKMRLNILGPDHVDTLTTKHNLAVILDNQGKYCDAENLYNEVLEMIVKLLGPNHPKTLSTKHNLAVNLRNQGKYNDAQNLYDEVLEMQIKSLGPDHPDTLTTKNNLADFLQKQGKFDDAEQHFSEVLEKQIKLLGPKHPHTLSTKHNMGNSFRNQGKYNEAQELYNEVLQVRSETLGPDHQYTLLTKHNLATVYSKQGKYDDAEASFNEVLQSQVACRSRGPEHPETLRTKYNLAKVYDIQGRNTDALELYDEVLEIQIQVLGLDHPDTFRTRSASIHSARITAE